MLLAVKTVKSDCSFVSQKSAGLLLLKCLLFVFFVDAVSKSFVRCR